jgi:hypothetical protein
MQQPFARLRERLTYANTMSTLAVFIALGGTSAWAATTLARNSVGSAQIRTGAVASSEIHNNSVRSADIRDRSIALRDLAPSTRTALRGAQGPAGPAGITLRTAVNTGGGNPTGNARGVTHASANEYTVHFDRDVSACTYSATLAAVPNGATLEQPPAGRITAAPAGGDGVLVKTYAADGTPADAPFHLIVAC